MRACDNPFAMSRIERVPYLMPDCDWEGIEKRLAKNRGRGALIGPHGHGKTTLLEAIAGQLTDRGYDVSFLRFNDVDRIISPERASLIASANHPRSAVMIDGAEVLPLHRWYRIRFALRHAGFVIITAHTPGYLPALYECRTTPDTLHRVIQHVAPREAARIRNECGALHDRFNGNVREVLRHLYDRYADRVAASY